jgi:hypothetical protein
LIVRVERLGHVLGVVAVAGFQNLPLVAVEEVLPEDDPAVRSVIGVLGQEHVVGRRFKLAVGVGVGVGGHESVPGVVDVELTLGRIVGVRARRHVTRGVVFGIDRFGARGGGDRRDFVGLVGRRGLDEVIVAVAVGVFVEARPVAQAVEVPLLGKHLVGDRLGARVVDQFAPLDADEPPGGVVGVEFVEIDRGVGGGDVFLPNEVAGLVVAVEELVDGLLGVVVFPELIDDAAEAVEPAEVGVGV